MEKISAFDAGIEYGKQLALSQELTKEELEQLTSTEKTNPKKWDQIIRETYHITLQNNYEINPFCDGVCQAVNSTKKFINTKNRY